MYIRRILYLFAVLIISFLFYFGLKSSYFGVNIKIIDNQKPTFEFRQYGFSPQGIGNIRFETAQRTLLWEIEMNNRPKCLQLTYGQIPFEVNQTQAPVDLPSDEIMVLVDYVADIPIPASSTELFYIKRINGNYVVTKRHSGRFKPINLCWL